MKGPTPSQTAGPYYAMALGRPGENVLVPEGERGRIRIVGHVFDGDRRPIEDAHVELWQADSEGHYRHPDDRSGGADGFTGFGRCSTDFETGEYWFETVKPGPVLDAEGVQAAPHVALIVQGRGMSNPVFTRIYFGEDAVAHTTDLVLNSVPEHRRHTVVAEMEAGSDPPTYRFDIRFQGGDETVFFDF